MNGVVSDDKNLAEHIGREIIIRYNERGADWECVGWSADSSKKMVLDGFIQKNGCIYLVGHDGFCDYILASKCQIKEEYEGGECGEVGEINEISENNKNTGLADLLRKLSKPHEGPIIIVGEQKRIPNSSNYFLSQDYLIGQDMKPLLPRPVSKLRWERPLQ